LSGYDRVEPRMNRPLRQLRFRLDHRWAPGHMSAYLESDLRARARLERHTAQCPDCTGVLASLEYMLSRLHQARSLGPGEEAPQIAVAVLRRLHEPAGR